MAKISTSLVNLNPVLHSGWTSEWGRGVEFHVTGSGRRRDPPPSSSLFFTQHRPIFSNPPTDAHVSSFVYAAKTTSSPITTQLPTSDEDILRQSGIVRRDVLFWPGSRSLWTATARDRTSYKSPLEKKKKRKTNTVSSTQPSC